MPKTESARSRAARIERQAQRDRELQAAQQEVTEEAQDQDQENQAQTVDAEGDHAMTNRIKREASTEYQVEAPVETPAEDPVRRRQRLDRRNARNQDRQRKPMNRFKEEKFDREVRWMYFLNMRHENEGTKEAVIKSIEPQLDPMSYQYEDLWRAIMMKVNHLRGGTQGYLKTHVSDILKQDAKNDVGRLAKMTAHAELAAYLQSIYSVTKFLGVFYFTQSIIDLRTQGPLALYYTKSLYANACAKTKLHLDWIETEKAYNIALELKTRQQRARALKAAETAFANNDDVAVGSFLGSDGGNGTPAAAVTVDLTKEAEAEDEDIVLPLFDKDSQHNREGFTVYLNNFPMARQFEHVTRKEFVEKLAKRQKKPKAEPTHVVVGMDNLFFDSEPPKPSAA